MKTIIIFAFLLLVLYFNNSSYSVTDEFKHKSFSCIDTRDNEQFSFNSDSIKDIKTSLLGEAKSFTVTDSNGVERVFSEESDIYIKCKTVSINEHNKTMTTIL